MRRVCGFTLCAILMASAGGFALSQAADVAKQDAAKPVKIYKAGGKVTAPELLPRESAPLRQNGCKEKLQGKVTLSLIVDEEGRPKNIYFIHPVGTIIDELAHNIASTDRFVPGTRDGTPVPVAVSVELDLRACIEIAQLPDHQTRTSLQPLETPAQTVKSATDSPSKAILADGNGVTDNAASGAPVILKVGGGVMPPVPVITPEAVFSDEARRAHYEGACAFSMVVDRNGMPRNIQMIRSAGHGLDENAWGAIRQYRFKPATRDGVPVALSITVVVNFKLG